MFGGASFDFPTQVGFARCVPSPDVEKEYLPFYMGWDAPPTLLVAMNGLKGGAKKCGDLLLGLVQGLTQVGKFLKVQIRPP
jgi:hypothetical protein